MVGGEPGTITLRAKTFARLDKLKQQQQQGGAATNDGSVEGTFSGSSSASGSTAFSSFSPAGLQPASWPTSSSTSDPWASSANTSHDPRLQLSNNKLLSVPALSDATKETTSAPATVTVHGSTTTKPKAIHQARRPMMILPEVCTSSTTATLVADSIRDGHSASKIASEEIKGSLVLSSLHPGQTDASNGTTASTTATSLSALAAVVLDVQTLGNAVSASSPCSELGQPMTASAMPEISVSVSPPSKPLDGTASPADDRSNLQNGLISAEVQQLPPPMLPIIEHGGPISPLVTSSLPPRSSEPYNEYEASSSHPGLVNLGNTCFLNSILQATSATRALRDLVTGEFLGPAVGELLAADASDGSDGWPESSAYASTSTPEEKHKIQVLRRMQMHWDALREQSPALMVCDDEYGRGKSPSWPIATNGKTDEQSHEQKSVELTAADMPMTMALLHLLVKTWNFKTPAATTLDSNTNPSSSTSFLRKVTPSSNSSNGSGAAPPTTLNPKELLKSLGKAYEQYNDYEQQDCHEVLRLLLDSCRMEEIDVIKKLRPTPLTDEGNKEGTPSSDGSIKSIRGDEAHVALERPLRPLVDVVFAGKLASMIICQGCGYVSHTYEDFYDLSLSIRPDLEPRQRKRDRFFRLAERWARRSSTPTNAAAAAAGTSFTASTAAAIRAGAGSAALPSGPVSPHQASPSASLNLPPRPVSAYDARTRKSVGLPKRDAQKHDAVASAAAAVHNGSAESDGHQADADWRSSSPAEPPAKPKGWAAWGLGNGGGALDGQRRRRMSAEASTLSSLKALPAAGGGGGECEGAPVVRDRFFGLRKPSQRKKKKEHKAASGMDSGTETEMATLSLAPVPVRAGGLDFSNYSIEPKCEEDHSESETENSKPFMPMVKRVPSGLSNRLFRSRSGAKSPVSEDGGNIISVLESAANRTNAAQLVAPSRDGSPAPQTLAPATALSTSRPPSSARNTPDHIVFKEADKKSKTQVERELVAPHLIYISRILSSAPAVVPQAGHLLSARASLSGWARHYSRHTPLTVSDVITAAAAAAQKSLAGNTPQHLFEKALSSYDSTPAASQSAVQLAQQGTGLVAALNQFTSTELLEEENAFKCKRCWRIEHDRRTGRLDTARPHFQTRSSTSGREDDLSDDESDPKKPVSDLVFVSGSEVMKASSSAGSVVNELQPYKPHPPLERIESLAEPPTLQPKSLPISAPPLSEVPREAGDILEAGSEAIASVSATEPERPVESKAERERRKEKQTVLRSALKRYLIAHAPPVLVIQFKRFQSLNPLKGTQSFKKIDDMVTFPEFLDLGPWLAPPKEEYDRYGCLKPSSDPIALEAEALRLQQDLEADRGRAERKASGSKMDRWMWRSRSPSSRPPGSESSDAPGGDIAADAEDNQHPKLPPASSQYRLYAVVVHQGSMSSGHYTAYVLSDRVRFKSPAARDQNGDELVQHLVPQDKERDLRRGWVFCSDDTIRGASWEEVAKSKAYMLFYERML
ncbi:cysteine proteinase [Tilletiaria anomala UBC 951]|uniref:ubiquitinyl hydrolase 1 n=1 Tax=Tilletiaria anomala (strain ATCC 24038 / CBS 436.72 / UBC 951) TaxID=1037660 RepID=A0A066VB79_TILAU|nr:cysteine proteinase [Tilletiaria anomala UBC 951]KDN36014.1 cysteine proteinase [Tilletiaria anomala UBC 951]